MDARQRGVQRRLAGLVWPVHDREARPELELALAEPPEPMQAQRGDPHATSSGWPSIARRPAIARVGCQRISAPAGVPRTGLAPNPPGRAPARYRRVAWVDDREFGQAGAAALGQRPGIDLAGRLDSPGEHRPEGAARRIPRRPPRGRPRSGPTWLRLRRQGWSRRSGGWRSRGPRQETAPSPDGVEDRRPVGAEPFAPVERLEATRIARKPSPRPS